jgi:CAAX protease family protein
MTRLTTIQRIALFLAITYALALLIALIMPGTSDTAPLLSIFAPVIATTIVISFTARPGKRRSEWGQVGLSRAGFRWWAAALIVPAVVAIVSYGSAKVLNIASFPNLNETFLGRPGRFALGLVISTVLILGEEIGWRGFLLFRLAELTTLRRAALLTGLAHALIHLPLLLLTTSYQAIGSRWIIVPVAMVSISLAGVFYAWIRLKSGSIWPVALAHNAFNTAFENIGLAAVTSSPAALAYVAGEGGIVTLALAVLMAWWLLQRSSVFNKDERITRASFAPAMTPANQTP